MKEPRRWYNQFKEVKEAQIYIPSKNVKMNVEMDTKLTLAKMGGGEPSTGQNSSAYQETRIILLYYLFSVIYRVIKQFKGSDRLDPNIWKGTL